MLYIMIFYCVPVFYFFMLIKPLKAYVEHLICFIICVMYPLSLLFTIMWRKLLDYYMNMYMHLLHKHVLKRIDYNPLTANLTYLLEVIDENLAYEVFQECQDNIDDCLYPLRSSAILRFTLEAILVNLILMFALIILLFFRMLNEMCPQCSISDIIYLLKLLID